MVSVTDSHGRILGFLDRSSVVFTRLSGCNDTIHTTQCRNFVDKSSVCVLERERVCTHYMFRPNWPSSCVQIGFTL
jgi:hypothetical protein